MPAPSKAMQQAAAIALHHPEKLYERNRSLKDMTNQQLKDYASTPHEGLPQKKSVPLSDLMKGRKRRKGKK
jgi:hypothetical protein